MAQPVPITTPTRVFEDRTHTVYAVADVPYSQRMVTSSEDRLIRLWDLKTGEVLKKTEGHTGEVMGLAVSRDGQMIVTGDENGELIAWQAKTGESLTKPIKVHGSALRSLDFSPDDAFVVTASSAPNDQRVKFWNTKTWAQYPGNYDCGSTIRCVRYARSGVYMLAVATDQDIQIYVGEKLQKRFKGHSHGTLSLAWSPDRTRLLSGGDDRDPSIREWDTSSWTQVGLPWTGHTYKVNSIAFNSSGTHAVSASSDNSVRLWQLSDKHTIAIFQHTSSVVCAAFSADGTRILSGGYDKKVTEWTAPMGSLLADTSKEKIFYSKVVEPALTWEITTMVPGFDSTEVQELAPTQLALKTMEYNSETVGSDSEPLQAVSMTGSFDSKSLQAVSMNENSDSKFLQEVSTTGGFDSKSLQAFSTTGSFDSKSQQGVSATGSFDSNSLQGASMSASSESNSLQAVSTTGGFDSKYMQGVSANGSFDSRSLQEVSTTGGFGSKSLQGASTTGSSNSKSLQGVSMTASSESNSLQGVSTTASSEFNSLQAVSTTASSESNSLQGFSTTASSEFNSLQAVSTTASSASKSLQEVSTIGGFDSKSPQAVSTTGSSNSNYLQGVSATGGFDSKSLQGASTTGSSNSKYLQGVSVTGSFDSKSLQGVSMTASSESNSLQGVSTTASSASKSQQSSSTVRSVLDEQSVSKAEQSVTKLEQSFTKSMRAVSKTLVITTDELLAITKTIRTASITGDLFTAQKILTQEITADAKNFASYANRSFVLARQLNWENALQDANKSLAIRSSLAGYIAKGIALCGKQLVEDARTAFDMAFTFTLGNMDATVFLYLIKAIALFNANRHKESMLRVEQLSADPSADPLTCGVVVASLRVQLGTTAFNGVHHSEAIEHFTAAVKASIFLAKSAAPAACEAFTVLFGWDIGSLWETSNKKLILALLGAGKLGEAFESYRFAMDASDEATKTSLHSWVLTLSL